MAKNSVPPSSPAVSLDAGQVNLIRQHLRKLTAYTDVLCEGDLSDVQPSSINVIADHAALTVLYIGEILDTAASAAGVAP
ncbi:hypothetical protein GIW57_05365 [Stenotrophomonas sp. PA-6-5C]|uniref:hypothetical protein n=1 Tax=Stenotrophomonas sp. PA-6-5C TaxID=2665487 RepID=UPI001F463739|nr:hypothetical protein [Stenotrophomonas sp. PA-6-5C]MCF5089605.1 hypothetical protein [Stenotrophomonas sp. PA-6-5C]